MPREIDEAFVEEAIEHYRRIDAKREEFEKALVGIELTVRSPDGAVKIVVNGAGEFRDVVIADEAFDREMTPGELATSVLAACKAASHARDWARTRLYDEQFSDYEPLPST